MVTYMLISTHMSTQDPDQGASTTMDPVSLACWLAPEGMTARVTAFDPEEGSVFELALAYDAPEHATPGSSASISLEVGEILCGKVQIFEIVENGSEAACEKKVPRGRKPADCETENRLGIHALLDIGLHHRQLVKVNDQAGYRGRVICHCWRAHVKRSRDQLDDSHQAVVDLVV
jgi:hypothetical protein